MTIKVEAKRRRSTTVRYQVWLRDLFMKDANDRGESVTQWLERAAINQLKENGILK